MPGCQATKAQPQPTCLVACPLPLTVDSAVRREGEETLMVSLISVATRNGLAHFSGRESICNLDFSCQCFLLAVVLITFLHQYPSFLRANTLFNSSASRQLRPILSPLCPQPEPQALCDWCFILEKGFLWGSPCLIDCPSVCRRHACLRLLICASACALLCPFIWRNPPRL